MKENFKDFEGLEKRLLKFKGFQDAHEPCHKETLGSVKRIQKSNLLVFQILLPYHTATVSIIMYIIDLRISTVCQYVAFCNMRGPGSDFQE